jgi:hypothetical protein
MSSNFLVVTFERRQGKLHYHRQPILQNEFKCKIRWVGLLSSSFQLEILRKSYGISSFKTQIFNMALMDAQFLNFCFGTPIIEADQISVQHNIKNQWHCNEPQYKIVGKQSKTKLRDCVVLRTKYFQSQKKMATAILLLS